MDIDNQVGAKVIKTGWSEVEVLKLMADGCRCSPGCDSLRVPIMRNDDVGGFGEQSAGHQGPA